MAGRAYRWIIGHNRGMGRGLGRGRRGPEAENVHAAFTWWRDLVTSLDDETLNTPLGEAAHVEVPADVLREVLRID